MGDVNFYLKKPASTGKSLIYLQYKYNGLKLTFTFGQTIYPKNWNKSKQRVKNNSATTSDGKHSLNDLLDNLVTVCEKAYNKEIKNGTPLTSTIKSYLIDFMNQQGNEKKRVGTLYDLIEKFISGEIKHNGKTKKQTTLEKYSTTLKYLKQFSIDRRFPVDFNTIDLDFYNKFTDYLEKKDCSLNTIGRYIKDIKTFMGEAADRGLTTNFMFRTKKFKKPSQETDSIYLTEKEINKIYNLKLDHHKRLEAVKDLFVFGCYVGLRFSDYSTIKPENIIQIEGDYFIKLITKKTNQLVIIPCNTVVLEIFKKYGNNVNMLPRAITNQKFNKYIKEVSQLAGLNEIGRLSTAPELQLWECISSHTARRSFATNYYLQGFPTIDLMKITGHKTEMAFMKYIKVTKLDSAKRLGAHMKKNWSEKIFRIA